MTNRNQQHVQVLELKAKGLSIRVIGDQLGISKSTVARMAQQNLDVPERPKWDNSGTVPLNGFVPRKCVAPDCRREYQPVSKIQLYCSRRCKNREAQRRFVKAYVRADQQHAPAPSIPSAAKSPQRSKPEKPENTGGLPMLLGHLNWEDFEKDSEEKYRDPWK